MTPFVSLQVGRVRLDVHLGSRLDEPDAGVLQDFLSGYRPAADEPPAMRIRVDLEVDATAGDEALSEREPLCLVHQPNGSYLDVGADWRVQLGGFDGHASPWIKAGLAPHFTDAEHLELLIWVLARVGAATGGALTRSLLLHGCAMQAPDGSHAVLFLGASGDGKTTMTRRLPGWTSLGDDTVMVELADDPARFTVRGTPFSGRERLPRLGAPVPLARLVVLDPGAETRSLSPLPVEDGFDAVLRRVMWYVQGGPLTERMVELAEELARAVPVARLSSSLHHGVVDLFPIPPQDDA